MGSVEEQQEMERLQRRVAELEQAVELHVEQWSWLGAELGIKAQETPTELVQRVRRLVRQDTLLERRIDLLATRLAAQAREWDALAELLGYRDGTGPSVLVEHVAGVLRLRTEASARCKAAEVQAAQSGREVTVLEGKVAQLELEVTALHARLDAAASKGEV